MKLFRTLKHEISTTVKACEYGKIQNGLYSLKTELQSKFCLESLFRYITSILAIPPSSFRQEQRSEEADVCQYLRYVFIGVNCHL